MYHAWYITAIINAVITAVTAVMYSAWYITAVIAAVTYHARYISTVVTAVITDVFAIRFMSSITDISAMIADISTIADVPAYIVSKA